MAGHLQQAYRRPAAGAVGAGQAGGVAGEDGGAAERAEVRALQVGGRAPREERAADLGAAEQCQLRVPEKHLNVLLHDQ